MIAALIISCLGGPVIQEDVEALIRQLGDDQIEVRERAGAALIELGEKAREALNRAEAGAGPELKSRITVVVRALDRARDRKRWVIPPARVSLSGEMTLDEAIRSIENQGGTRIACASWPEGKFRVDLKDIPSWDAVEAVCRASGRRSLVCDSEGPRLAGDR